jgi:NAD(P)H-hydrate repair Nnr-like enzyme with NAD(P)H-hydrate dehydratase domain
MRKHATNISAGELLVGKSGCLLAASARVNLTCQDNQPAVCGCYCHQRCRHAAAAAAWIPEYCHKQIVQHTIRQLGQPQAQHL